MTKIEEFLLRVYPEPNTGCWLWAGAFTIHEYGKVGAKSHDGFTLAHRYSFQLFNGVYDRKLAILHRCDNPACVNPDHLFLGTQFENIRDMYSKNRGAKGARVFRAKLDEYKVSQIRSLHSSGEYSLARLSKLFGVNDSAISKVIHRQNWKHVN